MDFVWLMVDKDKNVIAIYNDRILADTMKASVEAKIGGEVKIEKRSVNLDIKMVGVIK